MAATAATTERLRQATGEALQLRSAPERVALSWSMATGVLVGGLGLAVTKHSMGSGFLALVTALFALGAVLGYVHGGVLGVLGRPAGMGRGEALLRLLRWTLVEVPALVVGWLVAAWMALTPIVGEAARWSLSAGVVLAWGAALVLFAWAAAEGLLGLRNAYARWPHYRTGTVVLSATFVALSANFIRTPPHIWGTDIRLTAPGAVILALGITVWLVSPAVILVLQMVRRRWST